MKNFSNWDQYWLLHPREGDITENKENGIHLITRNNWVPQPDMPPYHLLWVILRPTYANGHILTEPSGQLLYREWQYTAKIFCQSQTTANYFIYNFFYSSASYIWPANNLREASSFQYSTGFIFHILFFKSLPEQCVSVSVINDSIVFMHCFFLA